LADVYSEQKIADYLAGIREVIGNCVNAMPPHETFIARHCATTEAMAA